MNLLDPCWFSAQTPTLWQMWWQLYRKLNKTLVWAWIHVSQVTFCHPFLVKLFNCWTLNPDLKWNVIHVPRLHPDGHPQSIFQVTSDPDWAQVSLCMMLSLNCDGKSDPDGSEVLKSSSILCLLSFSKTWISKWTPFLCFSMGEDIPWSKFKKKLRYAIVLSSLTTWLET